VSTKIDEVVDELARQGAYEVWLLGSRANGCATDLSDWDLLVIGPAGFCRELSRQAPWAGIDVLVNVKGRDGFASPWVSEGRRKKGSLKSWGWRLASDAEASYMGMKEMQPGFAMGYHQRAQRIFPEPRSSAS
jgi:hypothetical protein